MRSWLQAEVKKSVYPARNGKGKRYEHTGAGRNRLVLDEEFGKEQDER